MSGIMMRTKRAEHVFGLGLGNARSHVSLHGNLTLEVFLSAPPSCSACHTQLLLLMVISLLKTPCCLPLHLQETCLIWHEASLFVFLFWKAKLPWASSDYSLALSALHTGTNTRTHPIRHVPHQSHLLLPRLLNLGFSFRAV